MTTSTDLAKDHITPPPKSPLARLRRKLSPKKSTILLTPSPTIMTMQQQQQQQPLLQRVFDYFDKDGDGKISPAELQSCVRATGGQLSLDEAAAAVDSSDMDGDGLLGYYEFVKLMEGSGEDKVEEKNKELREAFGMYEMGGSGCITPASLRTMLSRIGGSHSLEDCKIMIRTFDLNGDGVLSFDEFSVMMR